MQSDVDYCALYPADARLIEIAENTKEAFSDYTAWSVTPDDFFGLAGNVAMVLDGQFLLVDIDAPSAEMARFFAARLDREAPTRTVVTPRGGSHRFYRIPATFTPGNAKLRTGNGEVFGDLKTLGYAVGPGSSINGKAYELVDNRDPVGAPAWLMDMLAAHARKPGDERPQSERDGVPRGEHDDSLVRIAGLLRGQMALSAEAIASALSSLVDGGLLADQDEARPYGDADFARIARSASKWPAERDPLLGQTLFRSTLLSAADESLVMPEVEWLVDDFVPLGELVVMWGKGGIGKSTVLSWLAAEAAKRHLPAAVMLTEEPFQRFAFRSVLGGAPPDYVFDLGRAWTFPRDEARLAKTIEKSSLRLVVVDAVYSHFDYALQGTAAERARTVLGGLAGVARSSGCAIIGNFHENKAGELLGSVEMENVARVALHATRRKNGPLRVRVAKTNFGAPGYRIQFGGGPAAMVDPSTGEVQLERRAGQRQAATIFVAQRLEDTETLEDGAIDEDGNLDPTLVARPKRGKRQKTLLSAAADTIFGETV